MQTNFCENSRILDAEAIHWAPMVKDGLLSEGIFVLDFERGPKIITEANVYRSYTLSQEYF